MTSNAGELVGVQAASRQFPDFARADSHLVLVSPYLVPDTRSASEVVAEILDDWEAATLSSGLLTLTCFTSLDERHVLTYAQWTDLHAYRAFSAARDERANGQLPPAVTGMREPVLFRIYRSRLDDPYQPASCLVAPSFDADGAESQRRLADSMLSLADGGATDPGLLRAHFHLSLDGTRVVNFAEWTSADAHQQMVSQRDLTRTSSRINASPGIRYIGFDRYQVAASRSLPTGPA